MTTTKNVGKAYMLSEVEKQIRKDIPRLMELREGCKFHSGYGVETIVCIKGDKEDVFIFKDLFSNVYETNEIPQHYKIIGHDIMLNDVLEWLGKVLKEATEYRIGYTNIGKFGVKYREMLGIMDLSKPLLKDQSEYFIKFLYEFKNEHFRI